MRILRAMTILTRVVVLKRFFTRIITIIAGSRRFWVFFCRRRRGYDEEKPFSSFSQSRSPVPSLSFRQSLDVAVVFVETSIHFVYTLHKWSRQWSKSSACAKSHVCLHFIAACIAAWCNFKTSKYSSSVLISALFTR